MLIPKSPWQLGKPEPKPMPRPAPDPSKYLPSGPAGVRLPEGGMEEREAFEAWLGHVEAGRIG